MDDTDSGLHYCPENIQEEQVKMVDLKVVGTEEDELWLHGSRKAIERRISAVLEQGVQRGSVSGTHAGP